VSTIFGCRVVDGAVDSVESFDEYVTAAWPRLLRSAWLLTGDWHRAEDLVQTVLARVCGRWPKLRDGAPDAYLRTMLASTYLSWWRRRWRGEVPVEQLPETVDDDWQGDVELRLVLAQALVRLPRQQRAVLMLRFHADLTEAATASALGISTGSVKVHAFRGLAALRADPRLLALLTEEVR
jgi:RNA polymerase sigma-70 factor (sigma-E family)